MYDQVTEELGVTKVELFEHIRREHGLYNKSIRRIAKECRVHRRMVHQALSCASPPVRKKPAKAGIKLTETIKYFIDHWIQADQRAPIKQRHTAHRIFTRLVEEQGYIGAEATIRRYVGERRRTLSLPREAFIVQTHAYGEEAEVDWYEAQVDFPSGRRKVYIFQMRACASGKEFHIGFLTQSQQAFFEGHVAAFEYFQGVFKRIRSDNLASAVKKVLEGRKRDEHEKFILLKSHYLFEAFFCRVGIQGAHEKGGVEGSVGRFRRNYLVPVPQVEAIHELNGFLKSCCDLSNTRKILGKTRTVEEDWQEESRFLLPLPRHQFSTQEIRSVKVNDKSLVMCLKNYYSVPVRLIGKLLEVHVNSLALKLYFEGVEVASHVRLYGCHEISMVLDHYLDLLRYKPGAFKGSLVLAQTKKRHEWPCVYDTLWQHLKERFGELEGTTRLIEVFLLCREFGQPAVLSAIESGLKYGACDKNSILVLLRRQNDCRSTDALSDLGCLRQYDRPVLGLEAYNQLLTPEGAS